jgi:hypothetical protein
MQAPALTNRVEPATTGRGQLWNLSCSAAKLWRFGLSDLDPFITASINNGGTHQEEGAGLKTTFK